LYTTKKKKKRKKRKKEKERKTGNVDTKFVDIDEARDASVA